MNSVKLKLVGINSKLIPNIFIDDQYVKCKKNEFGSYETDFQTEKDEIKIAFSRELELKSKLWWLYAILSFIVSVFGIFNPPYDRKCISMDCSFIVKLKDVNNINIKFNSLSSSGRAVEVETETSFEEIKNEYTVDKIAKRRWIILLIARILAWIGIAILLGWLIANQIG
ncbi:MAG TPA: hypothetical protein IAB72_03385 [Candidatus Onthoplasma faecipullorum]|nr:hypothetical protein [Candidatus Onthoplasma faecipullorum]